MNRIKNFIKDNFKYILITLIVVLIFNIKLPYYILAPGGIIKIDDRIEAYSSHDTKGSINLLYVTQYDGNISALIMSIFMKEWDVEKLSKEQISDETAKEIHTRSKIMLDNSVSNAIYVAYKKSGKTPKIKERHNIVLATTKDNDIKINDEIISANDIEIDNINTLKEILRNTNSNKIKLKVKRGDKLLDVEVPIVVEDNNKIIGIMVITNYVYDISDEVKINFKASEGGSSGGLMTAVSIYNAINDIDITKGLNIGGTGTIDINGNVGEIDGIKYKIMGAVKNNLDIVFVPSANYKDALDTKNKYGYDIEIVSVNTFDEVIGYLNNCNEK